MAHVQQRHRALAARCLFSVATGTVMSDDEDARLQGFVSSTPLLDESSEEGMDLNGWWFVTI